MIWCKVNRMVCLEQRSLERLNLDVCFPRMHGPSAPAGNGFGLKSTGGTLMVLSRVETVSEVC